MPRLRPTSWFLQGRGTENQAMSPQISVRVLQQLAGTLLRRNKLICAGTFPARPHPAFEATFFFGAALFWPALPNVFASFV